MMRHMADHTSTGAQQDAAGAAWRHRPDGSGPPAQPDGAAGHAAGHGAAGHGAAGHGAGGHGAGWRDALGVRWTRGPADTGPFRRRQEGRLAGGVAAGIAARTGFDVTAVRLVLVVLTLVTYGYGAAGYVLAWLVVPALGADTSIGHKAHTDKRGLAQAAAVASLVVVGLVVASLLHARWITSLAVPLVICPAGLVLIWRNAPADEQAVLRQLADPVREIGTGAGRSRPVLRALLSVAALAAGLVLLLKGHDTYDAVRTLAGIFLVIAAMAVAFGPWWLRIAKDRGDERQARIRAEERADMASRVHDSVLQTLALIQRRASDPQQVVQLARAQERELRSWLFDGRAPGALDGQATTVAGGVRLIQQEVEAQHGMSVDAVTVGDCELDDDLSALLAAAKEATVNAAKWSGADVVSLFAEVEPDSVSLFVRDRGRGFDPGAVSADRKGLAESVHARMARRGGSATVRSAPGEGTEVSLSMPRPAGDRVPRRP
jgi:signal transduction histidine kinase